MIILFILLSLAGSLGLSYLLLRLGFSLIDWLHPLPKETDGHCHRALVPEQQIRTR